MRSLHRDTVIEAERGLYLGS